MESFAGEMVVRSIRKDDHTNYEPVAHTIHFEGRRQGAYGGPHAQRRAAPADTVDTLGACPRYARGAPHPTASVQLEADPELQSKT